MTTSEKGSVFPNRREYRTGAVLFALTVAVLLALILRLWGIDLRSMSHPEIYVPGIDLVSGISEPPPRHNLAETIWWHFHDEPHPMGWYVSMLGWTKAFGTSHFAVRSPGVLFALGSIPLIFLIARNIFGSTVGCLAALLLSLHGFHVFWSQMARMYVAGAFLSLLATWFLLCLVRTREPRPGLEIAYVLSVMAGVLTVELFWPLIMIHVFWAALVLPRTNVDGLRFWRRISLRRAPRLLQVQALAFILSAPALTHAVYRARKGAAPDPSPDFLTEYFSFGFLFAKDDFAVPPLYIGPVWTWFVLGFALLLLAASLKAPKREAPVVAPERKIPIWVLGLAAGCSACFMFWLGSIAHRRSEALMAMSVLPFLALLIPVLGTMWGAVVPRLPSNTLHYPQERTLLLWLVAVVSPLILFAASYKVSILAPRAFLLFVPYLLILCAAGAVRVFQDHRFRLASIGLCVLVFAASIPYAAGKPGSPNDYQGIVKAMLPEMLPDDLVFLRDRDWIDTPLFYYINDAQFIVADHGEALRRNPDARVWLVTWPDVGQSVVTDVRREVLKDYKQILKIERLRASAELFEPDTRP
ncbi:glycosyltransferase family 39 protein [Ruegeria sp. YS9]|uniref:glycosyltransferase family 39 protein n=1 Tax=Ruegeria sp. YS9 TaxID=2966453 RepID=UPI00214BFEEF|nr:glycosyltransferase family 39 protein [Ruegeria sp. YS9]UUV08658.1 glycosyltransferase family 39 protein [Ruegeria sp. YS9]